MDIIRVTGQACIDLLKVINMVLSHSYPWSITSKVVVGGESHMLSGDQDTVRMNI